MREIKKFFDVTGNEVDPANAVRCHVLQVGDNGAVANDAWYTPGVARNTTNRVRTALLNRMRCARNSGTSELADFHKASKSSVLAHLASVPVEGSPSFGPKEHAHAATLHEVAAKKIGRLSGTFQPHPGLKTDYGHWKSSHESAAKFHRSKAGAANSDPFYARRKQVADQASDKAHELTGGVEKSARGGALRAAISAHEHAAAQHQHAMLAASKTPDMRYHFQAMEGHRQIAKHLGSQAAIPNASQIASFSTHPVIGTYATGTRQKVAANAITRPHAGLSDSDLSARIGAARSEVAGLKFGTDVERLEHPKTVALHSLLDEQEHRQAHAEAVRMRIKRNLARKAKPMPVAANVGLETVRFALPAKVPDHVSKTSASEKAFDASMHAIREDRKGNYEQSESNHRQAMMQHINAGSDSGNAAQYHEHMSMATHHQKMANHYRAKRLGLKSDMDRPAANSDPFYAKRIQQP